MEAAIEQTTTTTDAATMAAPTATMVAVDGPADYDGDDGGPKDITITNNIAKGKRTKRQRPQSPILFTFSSTNLNNMDLTYSPVSSSSFPSNSTTTEDQDTAESLILLSKGISLHLSTSKKTKDEYEGTFKFNSKKYIQSPTTGTAGIYVYECKTCSRTFSSFQALGGHRASHRKPKHAEDIQKLQPYTMVMDNNIEPQPHFEFQPRNNNVNYSSFSYQPLQSNNRVGNMIKSSSKLHECAICGTEFNSGQALGGHMRRHRVIGGGNKGVNSNTHNNNNIINNNNINNTTMALIPFNPVITTTEEVYDDGKSRNDALCLGLDLNLPAPRETVAAVGFSPVDKNKKEQPPAVHLSATPTLVDCHY